METTTLDEYTVPDIPYTPQELTNKIIKDKFSGYRALESEDYNNWQIAIEDAQN